MTKRRFALVLLSAVIGVAARPGGQGPALNNIMREKLGHAQKILEAVVTNDWTALETHSREMERLTRDPRWLVLKHPDYARHSSAFVRAIEDLHLAAAQRDLEGAPKAYVEVTLQCVACHRDLARERLAH
jgi:cytochrome c556